MPVEAVGSDIRDIQRQVFTRDFPRWIDIQPEDNVNSDRPTGMVRIRCQHVEGGLFEKVVSHREAIQLVSYQLRCRAKKFRDWEREHQRHERKVKRGTVAAARKAVREAQARLKYAEKGGDL